MLLALNRNMALDHQVVEAPHLEPLELLGPLLQGRQEGLEVPWLHAVSGAFVPQSQRGVRVGNKCTDLSQQLGWRKKNSFRDKHGQKKMLI